jgi:niacin transporter
MFLPMHLPVFLAGLLVGPVYGGVIGISAPILSHLLSGMPPLANATLFRMVFELAAYGFFSGLLYKVTKKNLYFSLLGSMIAGRIVLGFVVWVAVMAFGFNLSPVIVVGTSVVTGWPGLVAQVILIPLIVRSVGRGEQALTEGAQG